MHRILIVFHSKTGNTERMARAVERGVLSTEGAEAVLKRASEATADDLRGCDGIALGTPENFGYMSGMMKDFFDRTFYEVQDETFRLPCAVFISAGNDGTGALNSIERITLGYRFKKIYDPVIVRGSVTEEDLRACEELGQTLAAGIALGIY
ncbi:MAG: flavodoxin [delta proteobacterium MLS_D]|jgi:multimeric flavodoxin WrbA|nr:MAG: flavodoxin [delta proteobacterium MLS_D]